MQEHVLVPEWNGFCFCHVLSVALGNMKEYPIYLVLMPFPWPYQFDAKASEWEITISFKSCILSSR